MVNSKNVLFGQNSTYISYNASSSTFFKPCFAILHSQITNFISYFPALRETESPNHPILITVQLLIWPDITRNLKTILASKAQVNTSEGFEPGSFWCWEQCIIPLCYSQQRGEYWDWLFYYKNLKNYYFTIMFTETGETLFL